jgi:hypothetical protein
MTALSDTQAWSMPTVRGKAPAPRGSFGSAVVGRKLFVFGGGRIWDEGPVFNDTYSYDIGTPPVLLSTHADMYERSVRVGEASRARLGLSNSARGPPCRRTRGARVSLWRPQRRAQLRRALLLGRRVDAVLGPDYVRPCTARTCLSFDGQIRKGTRSPTRPSKYGN